MTWGKSSSRKVELAERRQKAISLRKAGASFQAIASKLSQEYGEKYSRVHAFKDVDACLTDIKELTTHDAEELRTLELERYDNYLLSLGPKIQQGNERAIATAIQISDRRCKLLGLDAPVKVKIEEGVENELRQFLDGLSTVLDNDTFQRVLQGFNTLQARAGQAEGN